jgi:hypothetical protein
MMFNLTQIQKSRGSDNFPGGLFNAQNQFSPAFICQSYGILNQFLARKAVLSCFKLEMFVFKRCQPRLKFCY